MTPEDFLRWLVAGSYLFGAGSYVFGWRILLSLKRIEQVLAREQGLTEGQNIEGRVTKMESNHRITERQDRQQDLSYRVEQLEERLLHPKQRRRPPTRRRILQGGSEPEP